ncbi:MAG: hypothetical protein M3Q16_08215 [Pseudomonadota bacterium]|nr:hypothetical protein [Pseudomonadota bacterium]
MLARDVIIIVVIFFVLISIFVITTRFYRNDMGGILHWLISAQEFSRFGTNTCHLLPPTNEVAETIESSKIGDQHTFQLIQEGPV